mgnify:CR=1 FL=1
MRTRRDQSRSFGGYLDEEDEYQMPGERIFLAGFDGVKSCTGGALPEVKLALERTRCLKGGGPLLKTPSEVGDFLAKHFGCQPQEQFLAVGFNSRNEVLGVLDVGTGGIDSAAVDPRVMFSGLILMGASAFIMAHNHPSGDPSPSRQDVDLTRQLKRGAELLTIRMLDHIVISRGGEIHSMVQAGTMPP